MTNPLARRLIVLRYTVGSGQSWAALLFVYLSMQDWCFEPADRDQWRTSLEEMSKQCT